MSNGIALASGIVEIATGPTGPTGATGATGTVSDPLTLSNMVLNGTATPLITTIPQSSPDTDGIDLNLVAGDANGDANGGHVVLQGGSTAADYHYGGSVTITAGNGTGPTYGYGGAVTITGGNGDYTAGSVTIKSGGGANESGNIRIQVGTTSAGQGGEIRIEAGISSGPTSNGGAVLISAGDSVSKDGGSVSIAAGSSAGGTAGGNITLTAGAGTPNGNLKINGSAVGNGTTACVLTATSGPTGANVAVQGWLKIAVDEVVHYIPFW